MVLYSVITTYHLLEAVVHKLSYNKEKQGVLMLSQWLADKYPQYPKFESLFGKIVIFDGSYNYSDALKNNLDNYYNALLTKNEITLEEMEEIHVFGAEHSFGAFIFINQIPNCYWEEGAGAISKKDSMLELFSKSHGPDKAKFQYEHHLGDGDLPFVQKRYYDQFFQLAAVEGDNLVHFDVTEELGQLSGDDRNFVLELFYGEEKLPTDKRYALLLTECFANLSIMSWQEQITLYQYLYDYFLSEYKLLIKPHPDDLVPYEVIFNESHVIRKRFPAKLLPYIFIGKPGAIATSSSTSIYGLRNQFHKVLEFNFKFSHEKQFYKLNCFFIALSIADKYIQTGYQLHLLGVNPVLVENFSMFCNLCPNSYVECGNTLESTFITKPKVLWIVDEVINPHENAAIVCETLKNMPDDSIVIFINSDKNYCFYHLDYKEIWKNIRPIDVVSSTRTENANTITLAGPSVVENSYETIFVYKKGDLVPMYEIKRELPNVGITVSAEEFQGDKEQIKILEGMLAATEKRLLYYINKEKEFNLESEEHSS